MRFVKGGLVRERRLGKRRARDGDVLELCGVVGGREEYTLHMRDEEAGRQTKGWGRPV